jgi:hypothetical protein
LSATTSRRWQWEVLRQHQQRSAHASENAEQAQEWRLIHTVPKIHVVEEQGREMMLEPWMEAKLLAVTQIARTPDKKHSPKSANYSWQPLRDILLIMLDTGMRPAEVFCMEWEHVPWDRSLCLGANRGNRSGLSR